MLDMLSTLTVDELNQIIANAQDLLEMKKTEQRRGEIISELNDLFAELIEMDCVLYYKNGRRYELEIDGEVIEEEPGKIVIA